MIQNHTETSIYIPQVHLKQYFYPCGGQDGKLVNNVIEQITYFLHSFFIICFIIMARKINYVLYHQPTAVNY